MSDPTAAPTESAILETANDRFKRSFGNWFWGSMITATVMHFLVFQLWPEMTAADVSLDGTEIEAIEIPPEVEIPPPPQSIARPAVPVISTAVLDEDVTIEMTTFESVAIEDLPPPPTATAGANVNVSESFTFTPMTVPPEILNQQDVERAMVRYYPPVLRDAQIGGVVTVQFYINADGVAEKWELAQPTADLPQGGTSNQPLLDEAALRVADVIEFSPAWNRDEKVAVWVRFPIRFQVRPDR